jgi:hypothetical protein
MVFLVVLFFFFFFCTINFTIIFLSLFLHSSFSFLFLCWLTWFSLPTTLSAPSQPLFCHVFTSPYYPPPTCHHITPPSYTLTTHWLAYCTNCTQPQSPAIPDKSNPYCNNGNTTTPKYSQRSQKNRGLCTYSPTQPPLFLTPLSSDTFTNYPNFYL